MKPSSSILMWFTVLFCFGSNNESKPLLIKFTQQKKSTLDSLQGKWINEDDSLNVVIINGRYWNEQYNDPNNLISNTYRLYFSDTLVNSQQSFSSISIDTTALTGQYILFASPDHSIDCYYLNGFYHDNIDTTFSISPPDGTMRDLLLFNKAH